MEPAPATDDRPSHGPYGELWWDDAEDEKRWRLRLTDAGKAFVEEQIEKWGGAVSKLLWHKYRPFARSMHKLMEIAKVADTRLEFMELLEIY